MKCSCDAFTSYGDCGHLQEASEDAWRNAKALIHANAANLQIIASKLRDNSLSDGASLQTLTAHTMDAIDCIGGVAEILNRIRKGN